jgi:hypothetical protein
VCQGVDLTSHRGLEQANGGAGASTHATAAFQSPISKTQVLHLFGFHSLVTTTPDAATAEVYDYPNTAGAAAIEAATEEFTTFLGTIPSRTATMSSNSIWVADSLALRPLRPTMRATERPLWGFDCEREVVSVQLDFS